MHILLVRPKEHWQRKGKFLIILDKDLERMINNGFRMATKAEKDEILTEE